MLIKVKNEKIKEIMEKNADGKVRRSFIRNNAVDLSDDEKDNLRRMLAEVYKIIFKEREATGKNFTIKQIEITLDYFLLPEVKVWILNDDQAINKVYKEKENPTFEYNNVYNTLCKFILDFKPF